ncbi:sulfatase [Lentisphaera marina]|uniref:sulfatase family protein n=1 Tax=Lentisphaera marina TaxID=1111041 RepID=UPI002366D526|nr:sulfatase [Lentisphaera marina]MDD7986423.1 sulfatase [Lentisphaera marina]
MTKQFILQSFLCLITLAPNAIAEAKKPNFVWLISEDNSVHYSSLYFKTGAQAPNIDKLAEQGVIFNNAFSNAPVCSVARSTLALGSYPPRMGIQHHRSVRDTRLPEDVKPIYAVMAEAGYHTSYESKNDYNFTYNDNFWMSRKDWRKRKEAQPFFHKQQLQRSHESHLQRLNREKDAQGVVEEFVSPRHPNTALFRQAHRANNKMIKSMQEEIADVIAMLQEDGVLEDTFVFYFGDHGGVMPGSKGYLYETGLHVPFVVRIPENFKHLVDLEKGTRVDGFIEFVDVGATVMHLAGIKPPSGIDGKAFMGPGISKEDLENRDETLGFADRFDEKYDLVRSLRKGDLKYKRNYQPFNYGGLHNNYRYKMAAYREWRELHEKGELNELQSQFYKSRPVEELYDVVKDPYETNNLASNPQYAEQLLWMRERLSDRLKEISDLSFFPESIMVDGDLKVFAQLGIEKKDDIAELIDLANLQLSSFEEVQEDLLEALNSTTPWFRYWALINCSRFGKQAHAFVAKAKELAAHDEELLVRVRAAEFLAIIKAQDPAQVILDVLEKSTSETETLLTLNSLVLLRDGHGYKFDVELEKINVKSYFTYRRIDYLLGTNFAAKAKALKRKAKQKEKK